MDLSGLQIQKGTLRIKKQRVKERMQYEMNRDREEINELRKGGTRGVIYAFGYESRLAAVNASDRLARLVKDFKAKYHQNP